MQNDEQNIRQLVATWMQATKSGNIDAILGLMTEDVVFLITGHEPMIGRMAFAAAAKGNPGQLQPKFDGISEIQEIKVFGDYAYMWTKLSVTVTPPGGAAPVRRAGHTLSVLRKENGKWLLARDANMLAPTLKS